MILIHVIHAIVSHVGDSCDASFAVDDFRELGPPEDVTRALHYLVKIRALRRTPWTLRAFYTPGPTFAALVRFVRRVTARPRKPRPPPPRAPLEDDVFLTGRLTVVVRDQDGRSRRGERVVIQGCGFV